MSKSPTAIKAIASLGVSDLARSLQFYRTFFSFQVADSYEEDGRMAWCWLQTASADLMLQQLAPEQQITLNPAIGQSWAVYIQLDDLDQLHHALAHAGFPVSAIQATSYATRECFVADPDGYELWLSAPVEGDE